MKNILILLLAVLFVTCKKESEIVAESLPVANFTTDKVEYDAGDVMILTNTSSNADNVRFTLPNGTTSRNASVSYSIDPLIGNVNLIVKLEAISKSGTKSDYIINHANFKIVIGDSYNVFIEERACLDGEIYPHVIILISKITEENIITNGL
mgnify:CR=1 FL=1